MSRSRKPALALAVLAAALGGCSFKLAMPPPPPSEWPTTPQRSAPTERCTASLLPPLVDTGAASLLVGLAVLERNAESRPTPIILGVASLPVIAGAIYGYIVTAECRRYQKRFVAP